MCTNKYNIIMHKSIVNYHVSEYTRDRYSTYSSTRIMPMESSKVTEKQVHDWEDQIKQYLLAADTFHDILEASVEVTGFFKLDEE